MAKTYKLLDNKHLEVTETIESVTVHNKKELEDARADLQEANGIGAARIAEIDFMLARFDVQGEI